MILIILCVMLYISNAVQTWFVCRHLPDDNVWVIAVIIFSLIPPVLWVVLIILKIKEAIRKQRKQKQQDLT